MYTDYTIGFEIHRQISYNKLFCNCKYSGNTVKDTPTKITESYLPFSLDDFTNSRIIRYYYEPSSICQKELDEQPPILNPLAISSVGAILSKFNFTPVNEIIFMRKYILDGSLKSGFQNTAVIGINGYFYFKKIRIDLPFIYLEEDSSSVYRDGFCLHRQGTPLVELVSAPFVAEPAFVQELLKEIGLQLRKLVQVTGIGSIRQDLNIDAGFGKVELKGVQDIEKVTEIITTEVIRQLQSKHGSHTRKLNGVESIFLREQQTEKRMDIETEIPPFSILPTVICELNLEGITHTQLKNTILQSYTVTNLVKKITVPLTNALGQIILKYPVDLTVDLINKGKSSQQIEYAFQNKLENELLYTENYSKTTLPVVDNPLDFYKKNKLQIYSYKWLLDNI